MSLIKGIVIGSVATVVLIVITQFISSFLSSSSHYPSLDLTSILYYSKELNGTRSLNATKGFKTVSKFKSMQTLRTSHDSSLIKPFNPLKNRFIQTERQIKHRNNSDETLLNVKNNTRNYAEAVSIRETCKAKYGNRKYLEDADKRLPPMFYTYPGSGNTWGRLLIEYATGIYTGSIYNDKTLLEALPGEFKCNWKVSVVKVHPHTHPFDELRTGSFVSDDNKCKRGGINKFEKAVLLIRNPYDSIWSEYQRRVTQSHVEGIKRAGFDWHRWQANAAAMSNSYHAMWSIHHAGIEKHFSPKNILYIRYEDLKNPTAQIDTLRKITDFLNLPSSHGTPNELKERLKCAFVLAESRHAHRSIDPNLYMNKDSAYTKPLACRMWAKFGTFANLHNYTVWNNYDCNPISNYPPVPMINVGPQGEYNHKWVKPGQKLIDFGGRDALPPLPPSPALEVKSPQIVEDPLPSINDGSSDIIDLFGKINKRKSKNKNKMFRGKRNDALMEGDPNEASVDASIRNVKSDEGTIGMSLTEALTITNSGKEPVGSHKPAWQR